MDSETIATVQAELEAVCGQTPLLISSVTQTGLKPVLSAVFQHVAKRRAAEEAVREARKTAEAVAAGKVEETRGWQP